MEKEDFERLSEYALRENPPSSFRLLRGRSYPYREEHGRFKAAYAQKVSDQEASEIVRKFARHFKLGEVRLNFFGHRGSGRASYGHITLSHNPSVGLIAHELAHIKQFRKGAVNKRARHGSKRWVRLVGRFITYGEKRKWWVDSFAKKRTRKAEALERRMKKEAEKDTPPMKLTLVRAQIKRWNTKLKRATTALKKLNRRAKNLEKKVI